MRVRVLNVGNIEIDSSDLTTGSVFEIMPKGQVNALAHGPKLFLGWKEPGIPWVIPVEAIDLREAPHV